MKDFIKKNPGNLMQHFPNYVKLIEFPYCLMLTFGKN